MATVTIDDPETLMTKKVDGGGKLYVGNQWAGKKLKIVVEGVEDDGESAE